MKMKFQLTLFAVAAAASHFKPCFGAEQTQTQANALDGTVTTAPLAAPPQWGYPTPPAYGNMPVDGSGYPVRYPPGAAYPAPGGQAYPVDGAYRVHPGAYQPVPGAHAPGAVSQEYAAVGETEEKVTTPATKERRARRAVLRALLFVVIMNVVLHIVQALEGGQPNRSSILIMFISTLPHMFYLGGVVNLFVKAIKWIVRVFGRLDGDDTPEKRPKTRRKTSPAAERN